MSLFLLIQYKFYMQTREIKHTFGWYKKRPALENLQDSYALVHLKFQGFQ